MYISTMVVSFWPIRLLKRRLINHLSNLQEIYQPTSYLATCKWGVRIWKVIKWVIDVRSAIFLTAAWLLRYFKKNRCCYTCTWPARYHCSRWQRPCSLYFRSDSGALEGRKPLQSSMTIAVTRSRPRLSSSSALHRYRRPWMAKQTAA